MPRSTGRSHSSSSVTVSVGNAIAEAMSQSSTHGTQETLADALGVDQKTVSRWLRGVSRVTHEHIIEIEDLYKLRRGQILFWAGLVDVEVLKTPHHGANVVALAKRRRARPAAQAATASNPKGKVGKKSARIPTGKTPLEP